MALGSGSGPVVVAKFVADTSKMTDDVDKGTSRAGDSLSGMASKAAVAIGGAFAVDAVLDFGKASVQAAMDDAAAQEKLAQTMRNLGFASQDSIDNVEAHIGAMSKQTAIADDDLRPAFDRLAVAMKDPDDALNALSLATDVAAGTGKDLSTVTDAMAKAAMGSTGALKKMGVETENADGSAKSLDEIMSSMSETFAGQASTAAGTAAGKMKNAQIQFGEFQEEIGTKLLPVLITLADIFLNTLLPAVSAVVGWIQDHWEIFAALGIALGVVGTAILVSLVPAFFAWAAGAWAAAAATLAAYLPFVLIGAAVAALAYLIITNWDTIKAVTLAVWDAIVGAVKAVFSWIADNWPLLLAIITGPIGIAVLLVVRHWDTIRNAFSVAWEFIKNTAGTVLNAITAPFRIAGDLIGDAFERIKGYASGAWDFMVNVFRGLGEAITAPVRLAWNGLANIWNSTAGAISVSIPDWVPVVGGNSFDVPDLPHLAAGGVLTRPTVFLGGEAGTEIVTPEDLMRQIVREETVGGGYELNLYPRTADAADIALGFRRLELLGAL